ncbi:MAG: PHP domain-containing protein [Candidatus Bathyarchaeota archaeon]|nr:PHP domain-containing protein [Candidatus Bathyarchaeota archaeon]
MDGTCLAMIIDLHIHSKNCSDGMLTVKEIFHEAKVRNIGLMSITDHDSIGCQEEALDLAKKSRIHYVVGVEIGISFSPPKAYGKEAISLDLLGYQFDINNTALNDKLRLMGEKRKERTARILENLNAEFETKGIEKLTEKDFEKIQASVEGTLGRPHIADYLIKKGIVKTRQEAFDEYLEKCNFPKFPVHLKEASKLLRDAGGIVVLAHPNDPHGISLARLTGSLTEQTKIIEKTMLGYIDGVECWHSRNDADTTNHYVKFAKKHRLIMTGGSDCHQKPILMGTIKIPNYVARHFLD